jgi:hypothetical protein
MKILPALLFLALISLTACVGDLVRGTVDGAGDIASGTVDVVTAPIP